MTSTGRTCPKSSALDRALLVFHSPADVIVGIENADRIHGRR